MFSNILLWLRTLNLFESSLTAKNEYELRNEKISTRIFMIMLIICILIIMIYTGQRNILHTREVTNPSYDLFQSLSLHYPQTLRCPCNNIAIPHKYFIHLHPQLHQICSSDFITQNWIDHIGSARGMYISEDFNYMGALIFRTLASFCHRANETIMIALKTFNVIPLITTEAFAKNIFIGQINDIITGFQLSTELTYYQAMNFMEFFIQTSSPLPSLFSNVNIKLHTWPPFFVYLPREYENGTCSCNTRSSCIEPLILKNRQINQSNTSSYFYIPGLFTGCYLTEAVRQSSLKCFYEPSCIRTIEEFLQAPVVFNKSILSLNSSITSRFNISSTIDQLLSKAMTEKWKENISHIEYFYYCKVVFCTYTFISKFNIIYMITIFIGLIGGLTKVLRIVIPRCVKFIRHRLVPPPIVENQPNVVHHSWKERLYLINYFSKPSLRSNQEIKQEIISTWIFFLFLLISAIVLTSYHSTVRVTTVHQIEFPTIDEFINLLADQYWNPSFSCPCSTIAIPYEKFFHINYTLHPVCSSYFVHQQWINHKPPEQLYNERFDFRLVHGSFFNALLSFCQASINHIDQSLNSFNKTLFITEKVLTSETFEAEVNSNFMIFKKSIIRSFARDIALISDMTRMNGLMSTQETNFGFMFNFTNRTSSLASYYYVAHIIEVEPLAFCRCYPTVKCYIPLVIYDSSIDLYPDDVIPGLYLGCLTVEGIRYSTLACLFNQSCVNKMSFWLQTSHVKAIDIDKLINFYPNSTVNEIENELFVDEWNYSISYRTFYEICHPDRCTYTLNQRNSFWIILTTVISLIGGLMKIFQIVALYSVRGIFFLYTRCRCGHQQREITPVRTPFIVSIRSILQRLYQLNLFHKDHRNSNNNEFEIRNEIISTRLYLILLFLSLIILTIYSSQVELTKTVIITNPSIEQYISLYDNFHQTLICPCTNISIYQETFLIIQPNFHQICSSDFVDSRWITGISKVAEIDSFSNRDFRTFGDAIFATIASLCQLSFTLINGKHLDFNRSSFITNQIIPKNQLSKEGQLLIDLFITTIENTFINSMQNIRDTIDTNTFISFYGSSTRIQATIINRTSMKISIQPRVYNMSTLSCSCYIDPTCTVPAALYDPINYTLIYYLIPGFVVGCSMIEATLQSNLISLYNQTWIDEFREKIEFDNKNPIPFYTRALNASRNSQYNITTSINDMMIKMMTESWYTHVNYSTYFEQCHPIECKYTYVIKYDFVYIISTIIGLIGGLDIIFRFGIPRTIKLIRRCWFKRSCQRQIVIISDTTDNI
ncbi:unnamed protein product [Adineta ricciae]|uniref:Uncharacterized protein n=1 Tax=Adineta ricciae TaxID=249248 RepID=A0A814NTV5_ADIRI|nr:unnamed protein product [Adineta ricciae]CAF1598575.1 unnamed protein product [Adineta ricciae]